MSNPDSSYSFDNEPKINNLEFPGIGRKPFALLMAVLSVVLFFAVDWLSLVDDFLANKSNPLSVLVKPMSQNELINFLVYMVLINLAVPLLLLVVVYLRIINISMSPLWLLALFVPLYWVVPLIRCLAYQSGYSQSGHIDALGKTILKVSMIAALVIIVLITTYVIAIILK